MFTTKQPEEQQKEYALLLQAVASMSGLFSDNEDPFLHYRTVERAFCRAFVAKDLSREDSSFDAKKSKTGIGLKTFLYKNGSCLEKVAEFNSASNILRELQPDPEKLIHKVASMRNRRIDITKKAHGLENGIYHCVARKKSTLVLFECPLETINLDKIKIDKKSLDKNTLAFEDDKNQYRFSLSKSTLIKRFNVEDNLLSKISVSILKDPFEILQDLLSSDNFTNQETGFHDRVILPLYSEQDNMVPLKSGLNAWNGKGRARDDDEVYIQIPSWIYRKFPNFFPSRDVNFDLKLPDGQILSAKPCQENKSITHVKAGKALMSNPNKDLGKWILRDVLNLPHGTICTLEMLKEIGTDSVEITKLSSTQYEINFANFGSYNDFSETYKD